MRSPRTPLDLTNFNLNYQKNSFCEQSDFPSFSQFDIRQRPTSAANYLAQVFEKGPWGPGPHGAQREGTIFSDGYPSLIFIDGYPSMNIIDGYPSMNIIFGKPSMNMVPSLWAPMARPAGEARGGGAKNHEKY